MEGNNKRKMTETLEEADLKSFPADSNISAGLRCYFLKLVGDLRLEDVVGQASFGNLTRREFVVRLEYENIFREDQNEKIKSIQKESGATIALISYPEGELYSQVRLELWGSNDQVQNAELLIVDAMTKFLKLMYLESRVPTLLMQAPFYRTEVYIPPGHVDLDFDFYNLEIQSGAWLQMDFIEDPGAVEILIFGSRAHIYQALIMVHKVVLEPYIYEDQESAKLEDENKKQNVAYVPFGQVSDSLLGASFDKVQEVEAQSGAQIQVDLLEDPGKGQRRMIRLKIFGSRAQIYRVLTMVHKAILEPYIPEDQESAKLEDENKQHEDTKSDKPGNTNGEQPSSPNSNPITI